MISERSTITIGLLVIILGGASFVTNIHFQSQANAQSLQELKVDIREEIKSLRLELKELRLELKADRLGKR